MKKLTLLMAMAFSLALFGCGGSGSDAINGKWNCGNDMVVEFDLKAKKMNVYHQGEQFLSQILTDVKKSGDNFELFGEGKNDTGQVRVVNSNTIRLVEGDKSRECTRVK